MFRIFKIKKINYENIENFCNWFKTIEKEIIESFADPDKRMQYLEDVYNQLIKTYEGYKGKVEFEYGFNENMGKWELNLFHLNNKYLIIYTNEIRTKLSPQLNNTWIINCAK